VRPSGMCTRVGVMVEGGGTTRGHRGRAQCCAWFCLIGRAYARRPPRPHPHTSHLHTTNSVHPRQHFGIPFCSLARKPTHFAPLKSASEQARAPTHTHAHERPHTHASANGGAHMSALPRACLRTADAGNNRCCDEQAGCTELPAWSGHAQSHTHTHPHTPAVPTSNALLAGTCRATFTSTFERTRPARASARQE
jgi:hypothetical protein